MLMTSFGNGSDEARFFAEFIARNMDIIAPVFSSINASRLKISANVHLELVEAMMTSFGNSVVDYGQIENSMQWVSDSCLEGDIEMDIAIALWLHGIDRGGNWLKNRILTS